MEEKVTNIKAKQRFDAFKTPNSINDFLGRNPDHRVTQMCTDGRWIYILFDIVEERTFTYKADLEELQ